MIPSLKYAGLASAVLLSSAVIALGLAAWMENGTSMMAAMILNGLASCL